MTSTAKKPRAKMAKFRVFPQGLRCPGATPAYHVVTGNGRSFKFVARFDTNEEAQAHADRLIAETNQA